jgi:hypothetical protein
MPAGEAILAASYLRGLLQWFPAYFAEWAACSSGRAQTNSGNELLLFICW